MTQSIEKLERMRSTINALIATAAEEARGHRELASVAAADASAEAYQRGFAAGRIIGQDEMRHAILILTHCKTRTLASLVERIRAISFDA
jgi:hypothetical protein